MGGSLNRFLSFARWLLRLRWLWDIVYGLALFVGFQIAYQEGWVIGAATIVVGLFTLAADVGLGEVRA